MPDASCPVSCKRIQLGNFQNYPELTQAGHTVQLPTGLFWARYGEACDTFSNGYAFPQQWALRKEDRSKLSHARSIPWLIATTGPLHAATLLQPTLGKPGQDTPERSVTEEASGDVHSLCPCLSDSLHFLCWPACRETALPYHGKVSGCQRNRC